MEKVTREYEVFDFNELSEDVKEDVKKRFRESLVESHFDCLEEDLKEFAYTYYGIEDMKLRYSLSYCQGDGLSFELDSFLSLDFKNHCLKNDNVFEKYLNEKLTKEQMEMLYEYLNCGYNIKIKNTYSQYCYDTTCKPDCEYFYSTDDEKFEDKMNDFIENVVCELINEKYLEICKVLEEIGYSYYDVNDEEVEEYIEVNEYKFLEDGSIF